MTEHTRTTTKAPMTFKPGWLLKTTGTYFTAKVEDRAAITSLGAHWNAGRQQWCVPPGLDLQLFSQWLAGRSNGISAGTQISQAVQGISLSELLSGVERVLANACAGSVWTQVELVNIKWNNGHVYLEVSERNERGDVLAKASAVIWASDAQRMVPTFQDATGIQLAAGIKLLVKVKPAFHKRYGFTLRIDALDAAYTLGDLEAKKRDIRARLKQEGLFDLNRRLPLPWDFNHVLVIAPEGGAGLGDFQVDAERLQHHGICRFTYVTCRFQGEGAPAEIRETLLGSLAQMDLNNALRPDAVAIIRGGGATNDMAWLNDLALVRCVCELPIPVITGIGHERDTTLLDEVANQRRDTPSKAIAGISDTIVLRTREAQGHFDALSQKTQQVVARLRQSVDQTHNAVQAGARKRLADVRTATATALHHVKLQAAHTVRAAAEGVHRDMAEVRQISQRMVAQAQREVPELLADIRTQAKQVLRSAQDHAQADWRCVVDRTGFALRQRHQVCDRVLADTQALARQAVVNARERSQALMREITGQGPEKTLGRGFAWVCGPDGKAVTSAHTQATAVVIQFRDGPRQAELIHRPASNPMAAVHTTVPSQTPTTTC